MAAQLALPLQPAHAVGRKDFIVTATNAHVIAFIDSWPDWPVAVVAIHGPSGSGKSHIASIWHELSAAPVVAAADLSEAIPGLGTLAPLIVEDVDRASQEEPCARALFRVFEAASPSAPVLLTGRLPPAAWPSALPDLRSRFAAAASFPLWAPDDVLLAAIAHKLFADCQLTVPDDVVECMLRSLERSPAAIRDFVTLLDRSALAKSKPVTLALVRELLPTSESGARVAR
jgi:chromosomal replication initiation ATPase DnaA